MTPATLPTGAAVGTRRRSDSSDFNHWTTNMVFIFGFIGHALAAIFYNFIIPRVGGVRLLFTPAGAVHEITSIPVVAASLAIASVALIFGIIRGISTIDNNGSIRRRSWWNCSTHSDIISTSLEHSSWLHL